jgi:hypothetical protein
VRSVNPDSNDPYSNLSFLVINITHSGANGVGIQSSLDTISSLVYGEHFVRL